MAVIARLYATDEAARAAAERLVEDGFNSDSVFVVNPDSAASATEAMRQGFIPEEHEQACIAALKRNRHLVLVSAPFGQGQRAIEMLEAVGTVDADAFQTDFPAEGERRSNPAPLSEAFMFPVLIRDMAAPLSEFLGIRTLSEGRSFMSRMYPELNDFSLSKKLGMKELIDNPAPLSAMLMLPTKSGKSGEAWQTSMGFPMLSSNPTPLSDKLGMKTLIDEPAPLSKKLNMAVLSGD